MYHVYHYYQYIFYLNINLYFLNIRLLFIFKKNNIYNHIYKTSMDGNFENSVGTSIISSCSIELLF